MLYVNINGTGPVSPYSNWATAATNIQSAIDAASAGDQVLVTNGVYQTGGRAITGQSLLNRVWVSKALTVQSVNGPAATVIQGYQIPGATNADGAIRCVYLTNGAVLVGFTLTNGATRGTSGASSEKLGGGVYCRAATAVVSNCVIIRNAALSQGGGAYQGALYGCQLTANVATNGGGAAFSTLVNCTLTGNLALSTGGAAYSSSLTNCVLLTNSAVSSGGGAYSGTLINCTLTGNTSVYGGGAYSANLTGSLLNSNSATRGGGAYSATVSGCVLTGNTSLNDGGGAYGGTLTNSVLISNSALTGNGGGACAATLLNCKLINNQSSNVTNAPSANAGLGGAAYRSSLNNCALMGNLAINGGGAYAGTLNDCTLTGNSALSSGGGAFDATLNNCITYHNFAAIGPNYTTFNGGSLNYCCTTPLPANASGCLTNDPLLVDALHLSGVSPCRGSGNLTYVTGTDIDGETWSNPPSIGCDQFNAATASGALSASLQADYTNVSAGFPVNLSANITGVANANSWDFGDGTAVSNRIFVSHNWLKPGNYNVVLQAFNNSNPAGVSAALTVQVVAQPILYVSMNNATPVAPYGSWAAAATNIQAAVDAATIPGSLILVSNGVYATGGRIVFGATSNRVVLTKPLTLQSVNGPNATWISGTPVLGNNAVRCVYLTNGAGLSGFTITNGAVRMAGDPDLEQSGGGIWCASPSVQITNCVVAGNFAGQHGGGVYSGTLANCALMANSASSGGATYWGVLSNCALTNNSAADAGGAANSGALMNCLLSANVASSGGGAFAATLANCVISNNSATNGGGVYNGSLANCNVSSNAAADSGGAAYNATLVNCTVVGNIAGCGDGYGGGGIYGGALTNCVLNNNVASNSLGVGGGAYGGVLFSCWLTNNFAPFEGGGAFSSTLINSVLVSNSVTLSTYLSNSGLASPVGGGAIASSLSNCVLVGNSGYIGGGAYYSTLNNCTVAGNTAGATGGGADSSTLNSCALTGNSAMNGGGANGGTLNNCTLTGNSAILYGGGANGGTLNNCIVYYNSAVIGANYNGGTFNYCCTTPLPMSGPGNIAANPLLADPAHESAASPCRGAGNPGYVSGVDIDGDAWANPPSIGCDEFNAPSVSGSLSVSVQADSTNVAVGGTVNFNAAITGSATANAWSFGDGTVLSDEPYAAHSWSLPGNYRVTIRVYNNSNPGGVSATALVQVISQPVHYVSAANPHPMAPYNSWATAATNIQDAINAATVPGALILVTNGNYGYGGQVVYGGLTNRVAASMPLKLQSVNGPAVTWIIGNPVVDDTAVRCVYLTNGASLTGFTLTNGATRAAGDPDQEESGGGVWCASPSVVVSNCVLAGNYCYKDACGAYSGTLLGCSLLSNYEFVGQYYVSGEAAYYTFLTNCLVVSNSCPGANFSTLSYCLVAANTADGADNSFLDHCIMAANSGAGVNASTIQNSLVTGNQGCGVYSSTAANCIISNNASGGASLATLDQCTLINNIAAIGGGAYKSTLNHCQLIGNESTGNSGGGAFLGSLTNCLLINNVSLYAGGGAAFATLVNCTVVSNVASMRLSGGGVTGMVISGTEYGTQINCIVQYNSVTDGVITNVNNYTNGTFYNCCTTPLPSAGNIANDPLFAGLTTGNLRLQSNSPCINAGSNTYIADGTDLDGRPRIVGGTVDIGAYEFQGVSTNAFIAWLRQYGLPLDGSADFADSDGTGMNNWQKWMAGLNPTNPASVFKLSAPALTNNHAGIVVSWFSVNNITYDVQRSSNLAAGFSVIGSNILGQAGSTVFTDAGATNGGPYFYRIGVQ